MFKGRSFRKVLGALVVVAVVLSSVSMILPIFFGQPKQNQIEIADAAKRAVTIVSGTRGYGSGVIIKSNDEGSIILTNKHVCDINKVPSMIKLLAEEIGDSILIDYTPFKIIHSHSKKVGQGQVLRVAQNTDLCLIFVDIPNLNSVEIANKVPKNGERLFNISNPLGYTNYITEGFAGDFLYIMGIRVRQVSIPVSYGSSGSGVFNNDGELVGLVSMIDPSAAASHLTLSFMIPLTSIKMFLKGIL